MCVCVRYGESFFNKHLPCLLIMDFYTVHNIVHVTQKNSMNQNKSSWGNQVQWLSHIEWEWNIVDCEVKRSGIYHSESLDIQNTTSKNLLYLWEFFLLKENIVLNLSTLVIKFWNGSLSICFRLNFLYLCIHVNYLHTHNDLLCVAK